MELTTAQLLKELPRYVRYKEYKVQYTRWTKGKKFSCYTDAIARRRMKIEKGIPVGNPHIDLTDSILKEHASKFRFSWERAFS